MGKIEVLQHRNSSHQIFITSLTLMVGLGGGENDLYKPLILIISFTYYLVIFFNMYKELRILKKKIKKRLMLKNQITLILPIAFLITILCTIFNVSNLGHYYVLILMLWMVSLILLYVLVVMGEKNE